jgi:death on curing protein
VTEPRWLTLAVVMAIHEAQIAEHGGSLGIRDAGLLESALARPRNQHVSDKAANLTTLAAAYAFGIAKNHPFVDGNKRTAWVVCATFLEINGSEVTADQSDVVGTVLGLAAGDVDEAAFTAWLDRNRRKT